MEHITLKWTASYLGVQAGFKPLSETPDGWLMVVLGNPWCVCLFQCRLV